MPDVPAAADPLTTLLYRLQDGRQRATYGAVAGMLGAVPLYVMSGRPRNPLHSWVVSAKTGQPSKYEPDQIHADLLAHDRVLTTADELRDWLGASSPAAPDLNDGSGAVAE